MLLALMGALITAAVNCWADSCNKIVQQRELFSFLYRDSLHQSPFDLTGRNALSSLTDHHVLKFDLPVNV